MARRLYYRKGSMGILAARYLREQLIPLLELRGIRRLGHEQADRATFRAESCRGPVVVKLFAKRGLGRLRRAEAGSLLFGNIQTAPVVFRDTRDATFSEFKVRCLVYGWVEGRQLDFSDPGHVRLLCDQVARLHQSTVTRPRVKAGVSAAEQVKASSGCMSYEGASRSETVSPEDLTSERLLERIKISFFRTARVMPKPVRLDFEGYREGISRLCERLAGSEDVAAPIHGDLAVSNLLITDQAKLFFLDLDESGLGPIGWDLGEILIRTLSGSFLLHPLKEQEPVLDADLCEPIERWYFEGRRDGDLESWRALRDDALCLAYVRRLIMGTRRAYAAKAYGRDQERFQAIALKRWKVLGKRLARPSG